MSCELDTTSSQERSLNLPEGVPPLSSYYVHLTQGCNLACRHCWLSPTFQPNGGTGGHLDYELLVMAIEEGLSLGLGSVKLTGGEPLLHPDFTRIVDLLRENNLGCDIETNGTLLTEALAHFLKDRSTLRHISVSIDGAEPASHDAFRGVEGCFEKACQAVQYLARVGYRPQVIMSIHCGNMGEMESLVRLAEELGAGSVKFNIVQPTGRGEVMTKQEKVLDFPTLVEKGRWVQEDLQKRASIPLVYSWPMAFFTLRRLMAGNNGSCSIFKILGILPSGHISMCGIGTHIPKLCYGKLGEDRVADIWVSHPILIELRDKLATGLEGICGKCILHERCLGSCVAENYHLSGRLTAPYWFCQKADELGLFPSSRRWSEGLSGACEPKGL